MLYDDMIKGISCFSSRLQDEESKSLFDARFEYLITRDKDIFYSKLDQILGNEEREYRCGMLQKYYSRNPQNTEKDIVVFGAGEMGKLTCRSLVYLNKNVRCICDNNKKLIGKKINGFWIKDFEYLKEECRDCLVIIAVTKRYQIEIYHQLIAAGFHENNIYMNHIGAIYCDISSQYFDLEAFGENQKEEYFVDAGCYNGETSIQCERLLKERLKKVYAFEADAKRYTKLHEKMRRELSCEFELFSCATWSSKIMLNFDRDDFGSGSRVAKGGEITVEADSIDNKLYGRKVTFIKLDVEGSELETLKGTVQTIQRWRPKLAISVYHKPEDIVEIPIFLNGLGMDYKYYIRQYQTRMQETVLYAL